MQFQLTRYEYVKTIEFKTAQLQNVTAIRYFKEEGVTGTFTKKEFRYSWDDTTWTNWNTLTQGNLSSIVFRDRPYFYLEIKYTREGIGSGNIQRWYLFYDSEYPSPPTPPGDASIDADTFGGEPPEYYLNRENHFGPYTDLEISNVPDGSTIGVYSHRSDSSLGTEFFFKRLEGGNQITLSETGGIITIDSDASGTGGSGTYDTTLDPSLAMPNPVGGIPAGTLVEDLKGDTFTELFDDLLFPSVDPTLTAPSGSFAMSPTTTLYEVGDTATLTFTSTLDRGSINPQYTADSPYRSGPPNNYDFTGTGLVDVSTSANPYVHPAIDVSIAQGNQSWSVQIGYDEGVQPFDNKGNPYDSSLAAGTLTASPTRTIEGVYPLFATTSNITTLTKQSLVSMNTSPAPSSSGMILVAESGGNKQKFDIPDKWTAINPLTGVQQYNTVSASWEYPGGSAAASLLVWTTSSVTQNIQGVTENYTRYTYNGADRSSTQIRLLF